MPNVITPFGFVKKAGDTMTGKLTLTAGPIALDVGLNTISLTNSVNLGACIKGGANHYLNVRNRLDADAGHLTCAKVIPSSTVDGVDVSEIGKPAGGLYLVSNQLDITNNLQTLVELETIHPNFGDGVEDTVNHKITPGVAGFYMVVGQITYTSVVTDKLYRIYLIKGAASIVARGYAHSALADDVSAIVGIVLYLESTDYIRINAYHNAGVDTVDILAGIGRTFLTLERLR